MNLSSIGRVSWHRLGQAAFNGLITKLPSLLFGTFKIRYLRLVGVEIGANVRIGKNVRVLGPQQLTIERDVSVAHSCVLDARGQLSLCAGALIGFESVLLTFTHASPDPNRPIHWQGVVEGPVVVGPNAWVGARCMVLPGAELGAGSIVGAMSVVSRAIPAGVVAGGVPAKVIKQRNERP